MRDIIHSDIYCQGELLCAVQTSNLFPTSKTFVDMKMLRSKKEILNDFTRLKNNNFNVSIPRHEIRKFVEENFAFDSLDKWMPPDFKEYPPIMDFVTDGMYK